VLPPKTASFPTWAKQLAAQANDIAVTADLAYWQAMPTDHGQSAEPSGASANLVGTAEKIRRVLLPGLTRDLLHDSAHAYNTRVEDMLLTALLLSFHRLTGDARLRVNLEGHGRDTLNHPIDLSRTVGWFTCAYPVDLILDSEVPGEALVGIKEQLRGVPGHGLAYAMGRWLRPREGLALPTESGIVFNYLGQFDQMLTRRRLIRVSEESSGPDQGPNNRRNCLIEILSLVFDGCLRVEWHYHPACHSREQIERWADEYVETLTALVAHCCNPANGAYTPADFPSVGLGFAEIEAIRALAAASNGVP
jgi:non-ribosomal peptide synthase protein (TIGR01720 family)